MNRIFTICGVVCCLLLTDLKGQTPGPFYRQFFFNPYLFNPAFVGIAGETETTLVYRQQWANFKEAPVTAGLSAQLPVNDRVALGLNIVTDKQIMLRNSTVMATFGYVVPFSENQTLRFGLSGGIGLNKLDLTVDELSSNDPAILNAAGNNYYVDGNFGVVYTLHGLRAGFALTNIFKTKAFNTETFNSFELSELRNRIFSLSYRFNVGIMENFSLEPYVLYRQTEDKQQDSWEAAALIHYRDKFWAGGGYNQNNGLAVFLGMNIKDRLRLSYSYEFPPFTEGLPSFSSHELHLGIRFGKKKAATRKAPNVIAKVDGLEREKTFNDPSDSVYRDDGNQLPGRGAGKKDMETPITIGEQARVKPKGEQPAVEVRRSVEKPKETVSAPVRKDAASTAPVVTKKPEVKAQPAKAAPVRESFTVTPGHHYVVVGVFSVMSHSMKFSKEMISKGYRVNVILNPKNNFYYVYMHSTLDLEEARKVRNEYRLKHILKEAWIFTME